MFYPKCKVYNDGSHYIALPHTTRSGLRKRPKPPEEVITVAEKIDGKTHIVNKEDDAPNNEKSAYKSINDTNQVRLITKKELFDELYEECKDKRKREKIAHIASRMSQYFKSEKDSRTFVDINLERKQRNLICRKVRLYRKARLQPWNYFCTFTYDNAKHTEESFRKKLSDTFKKMCHRRGLEIYRRVGTFCRKTTITFSRIVLYSRRTNGRGIIRSKGLLSETRKSAKNGTKHLLQRKIRTE